MGVFKQRALALSGLLAVSASALGQPQEVVMDFDWDIPYSSQLDDQWKFAAKGSNVCNSIARDQDYLCNDAHRLFLFYAGYDSDHMGWMRYGVLRGESKNTINGNGLAMEFTGGRAENEAGTAQDYGMAIKSQAALALAKQYRPDELYAERPLPAAPTLYYKNRGSNSGPLGVFQSSNRFQVSVWMPPRPDRHERYQRYNKEGVSSPRKSLAWYPFIDDDGGAHYYHHVANRPYGGWVTVEFDAHPTHRNVRPYNATHSYPEGGFEAVGDGVDYFSRIAAFALRFHGIEGSLSPTTVFTDEWVGEYAEHENEETIANLGVGYDPEEQGMDISLEDKYRCGSCSATYEVRYSFSPIDNGNFEQAKTVARMENFFINDDNDQHHLIKPNPGYNLVWGKFFLQPGDWSRFEQGETLYVGVRDRSERTFTQGARDTQYVSTPHGDIERQRLVKVIDVTYKAPPKEAYLALPSVIHTRLQQLKTVPFAYDGVGSDAPIRAAQGETLRPDVIYGRDYHVLSMDPYQANDRDVQFATSDYTGSPTKQQVTVKVNAPLCGVDVECQASVIADFRSGEAKLAYEEFNTFYHDTYSGLQDEGAGILVGNNSEYTYHGIKGDGLSLQGSEQLKLQIKNIGDVEQAVAPRVSARVERRPSVSPKNVWRQLHEQLLRPGESGVWQLPVEEIALGFLPRVTVNIGADSREVVLQTISLASERPLNCIDCGSVLVDFYKAGDWHATPVDGWSSVIHDRYTGKVNDGMGIIIGSNGEYNYQGIQGNGPLPGSPKQAFVFWKNIGKEEVIFSPRYSFNDPDRVKAGASGSWTTAEPLTIAPGESVKQSIELPWDVRLINTNVNVDQAGTIVLDKITVD